MTRTQDTLVREAYMTTPIFAVSKNQGRTGITSWSSLLHHLSNSGRSVVSKRRWPSNTVSTSRVCSRTQTIRCAETLPDILSL